MIEERTCGCGHVQQVECDRDYRAYRCEECGRLNTEMIVEVERKREKNAAGVQSHPITETSQYLSRHIIDSNYQGDGRETTG